MTPPLPPGVEGHPVAPHIHTAVADEPEREGWTPMTPKQNNSGAAVCELSGPEFDSLLVKARALDVAIAELHELQDLWGQAAYAALADDGDDARIYRDIVSDLSILLHKIGATR